VRFSDLKNLDSMGILPGLPIAAGVKELHVGGKSSREELRNASGRDEFGGLG
jgi:hypothetical protein